MAKKKGDGLIQFTDEDYKKIETMAGYGLSLAKIAALFGRSLRTFQNYKESNERVAMAIEAGKAKAHLQVHKTAYDMAVSGKVPQMTMFWLKSRAGWKETEVHEVNANMNVQSESVDKLVGAIASLMDRTREVKEIEPIMLRAVNNDSES
jgi:hypothetical protein